VKERIIKGMIDLYEMSEMSKDDFIDLAKIIIK